MNFKFELQSEHRYYHFVVITPKKENGLQKCIKNVNDLCKNKKNIKAIQVLENKISKIPIDSTKRYSRSEGIDYSLNKNNEPPFVYDLVTIEITRNEIDLLILVFPFSNFAKDIIEKLINDIGILKECEFQEVDLVTLAKIYHEDSFDKEIFNEFKITGIELATKPEADLRALKLAGKEPLKSDYYTKFIASEFKFNPQKIVFSCKLNRKYEEEGVEKIKKLRATIHIDYFGNYKFYIHQEGINLDILPFIIFIFQKNNCLKNTNINPLLRYIEDETN